MARPTLGELIRKIDYFGAKKEYGDGENPDTQLIDLEDKIRIEGNLTWKEVKDGFVAFREKVSTPQFIGRHSPTYWILYSTTCVLKRLVDKFKDVNLQKEIGQEYVATWLSLLNAGPSSGHVEIMINLRSNSSHFSTYLKTCSAEEVNAILSKLKITIGYGAEETEDEDFCTSQLLIAHRCMFECINKEYFEKIQPAVLDLYMHYQRQQHHLSNRMAIYVGYLMKDLSGLCPDKNPFTGIKDVKVLKTHFAMVKEFLVTFEGNFGQSWIDTTLNHIITTAQSGGLIKDIFADLMDAMSAFVKRKTPPQKASTVYTKYRAYLFCELKKANVIIDVDMFENCIKMMRDVLESPHPDPDGKFMVRNAMEECIWRFTKMTLEQVKTVCTMLLLYIKSGEIKFIRQATNTIKVPDFKKIFKWKELVPELKAIIVAVEVMSCDQMEVDERTKSIYDTVHEYRDFLRELLEVLEKHKLLPQIQQELVTCVCNCLDGNPPQKIAIAEAISGTSFVQLSITKDLNLIDDILERCDRMLNDQDLTWKHLMSVAVSNLLTAVILAYGGNGKSVSKGQNAKFMSIFATACKGDSIEEQFMPIDDDEFRCGTVHHRIFSICGMQYIIIHKQSTTLDCCITFIRDIVKWTKISMKDEHQEYLRTTLGLLQMIGMAVPANMADMVPDIVEIFFTVEQNSYVQGLLTALYPFNPDCVHKRLNDFIDKLKATCGYEFYTFLNILDVIATKQPEVFTSAHLGTLIDLCQKGDATIPTYQTSYLITIKKIIGHAPDKAYQHFSKFMDDEKFKKDTLPFRIVILAEISGNNSDCRKKLVDYLMKYINFPDVGIIQAIIGQLCFVAKFEVDYMQKYKQVIQNLENSSVSSEVQHSCHALINVIEGKNIDVVFEEIQQQQEDISDLDKKVDATITTVVTIGDHVVQQSHEISKVSQNVEQLEERVDDVQEDLGETKVKVEEIDNKTMTNAPKWSRDLTKLMNSKTNSDWRLLATRLGYKNDDIRGWAQQHDPCMALLSEWYATHKTSEATFGLLTALQEMNRLDGVVIVENAMKTVEGIVEDEEFEYPSPPEIFLSYQWGVQNEVKLLKQHLNMAGYQCWMDVGQMGGGDKLFAKIDSGIRAAKVVICCTTEKYAQSPNCNREVNLSISLGKPIIPLMMTSMSWPPKGSMGPIFSEYLFIRFFQRPGEETTDQRYWPVPKFQELLMQLNYYAAPKESLVKPEYSKWWMPIMEDIKVDKNVGKPEGKLTQGAQVSNMSDVSPVVFLSYQWSKQPQVKALYQRLTSMGYTVWLDIFQMGGGDSLYDKIDRGIRGCKVIVSCVTPKYALSANCRREISLADALKKPIVPLLLEQMKWPPDGPMSMVFTELLFINVYRDLDVQNKWTGEKFDELINKLQQYVQEAAPSGEVITPVPDNTSTKVGAAPVVDSPTVGTAPAVDISKVGTVPVVDNPKIGTAPVVDSPKAEMKGPEPKNDNKNITSINNVTEKHNNTTDSTKAKEKGSEAKTDDKKIINDTEKHNNTIDRTKAKQKGPEAKINDEKIINNDTETLNNTKNKNKFVTSSNQEQNGNASKPSKSCAIL